jgi:hypothetical protein
MPEAERARQTESLIGRGETDLARWKDAQNLHQQWDARAAMAADHIPAGSTVLDVGCGAMALGRCLKAGCRYFPADVVERAPGCRVVDLNKREFPGGSYDWVTFLGVLEYIHDMSWPLARAHEAAPGLVVTYCTHIGAPVALRRGMGWVNDLTQPQFEAALAAAGWSIRSRQEVKRGPTNIQMMFACARAA